VVANKADLRSPDEIEEILDGMEACLDDCDIPCVGISAYSAVRREELLWRRQSLFDFLKEQNSPKPLIESLKTDIHRVCDMYKHAIEADIANRRGTRKLLKSLELDLLESGFEEAADGDSVERIGDRLVQIAEPFGTDHFEEQLAELEEIRKGFIEALHGFSQEMSQPCNAATSQ